MARDKLDELEEAWRPERPTVERIRAIEQKGEPASYPPASSVGKAWTPRGVGYACGAVAAAVAVIAGALAPLLVKPDYTGWVREELLTKCEAKLDDRAKAHETALDGERERTSRCYDRLGTCQSQAGASKVVIESYEESIPKSRRMPRVNEP